MTNYVGQQFGNYRLLRVLGQGSFASVYLGEHLYLERLAAVKILHVRMEAKAHEAFRREARTIAHLDHPHIVRVLDFGIQDQTPYLVMEYSPNGTLRTLHPKGSRLSCEQIVHYVKQIASALDSAHRHGVIHRDVKPGNLLVNARGEVLLSDFGLAVVEHTLDTLSRSKMAGTPLYMAPEQILHRPCPASDQYALGVMVYEWLVGAPPFPGPGFAIFAQHLYQPPPSLCAYLLHLHPTVEAVMFRALTKDPAQRFACVTDFATALEDACSATQSLVAGGSKENLSQQVAGPTQPLSVVSGWPPSSALPSVMLPATTPLRPQQAPAAPLQGQNRLRLLRRVRTFWIEGVLEHSLHGAALMPLGLQAQPDAVANPWYLVLQSPETAPHPLPAGTHITQVYDDADGELLILGAPGAGKTTLLLELARDLLRRAEHDEQHPMPVVFNLSSWASQQPPLQDWLAEELVTRYQVPRKLAQALLSTDQILPLLDGLDEVAPTARTACIEAINTSRKEHGLHPLVVCSRQADYLAQNARVLVRRAVTIQPLTQEQVDAYLAQGGAPVWALRVALHQDATLRELTRTPLLLSILTLTYHGKPVEDLRRGTTLEERLRQIFGQYVQQMLTRRGALKAGTPQQMVRWLTFLAARMRERHQTVFYLEQLQPDWLPSREKRMYARLGVRLPGILIGILAALGISEFYRAIDNPPALIISAVLGGFLGGLFSGDILQGTSPSKPSGIHSWQERLRRLVRQVALSAAMGVLVALGYGLYLGKQYGVGNWLHDGSIECFVVGLDCLLFQWLCSSLKLRSSSSHNRHPQRWKHLVQTVHGQRALRTMFIIGLIGGLGNGQILGLRYGLAYGLYYGLSYGLYFGLPLGLVGVLVSLILDGQGSGVSLAERLHWTWGSLMNSLLLAQHRKTTLLFTSVVIISYALYAQGEVLSYLSKYGFSLILLFGPSVGLSTGLIFGLSYWIVFGLFRGISSEQIEEQSRLVPGQGIHRSLRSGILMGIITWGVIWLISVVSYGLGWVVYYGLLYELGSRLGLVRSGLEPGPGLIVALDFGLRDGMHNGWFLGLCGGLLLYAMSGGLAAMRHGIIRLLLRRAGVVPPHYARFLDEAASCILLQKVGGGYSFVHRLLLEYFASLE